MKPAHVARSALAGAILFSLFGLSLAGCIEHQPRPIVRPRTPTPAPTQSQDATGTPPSTPTEGQGGTLTPEASPTPTQGATPTQSATPTAVTTATPTPEPPTPTLADDVDYDGDGFSAREGDCQPLDPRAYPGALDLPFDGRDDNCNGVQDQVTTLVGAKLNEGGAPDTVRMDSPWGLARAADGTLYYSDSQQCRVRRIKGGVVTTVAGTGTCGFNGDGLPGAEAMVNEPLALALDETRGWLLIADNENNRVRRLHLDTGILDTLAGTGNDGDPIEGAFATAVPFGVPTALAVAANSHQIYVALTTESASDTHGAVWRLDEVSGGLFQAHRVAGSVTTKCGSAADGPALQTPLCTVTGLAVTDNGQTVYLTQFRTTKQSMILKLEGGQLTSLIGDGSACTLPPPDPLPPDIAALCHPFDVALGRDGDLYYTSAAAPLARLDFDDDLVYWLAGDNSWLFDVNAAPAFIPEGPALEVPIDYPHKLLETPDGSWWFTDTVVGALRRFTYGDPDWVETVAGAPATGRADGPLAVASLREPNDIEAGTDPETGAEVVYIADYANFAVRKLEGGVVTTVAGIPGTEADEIPVSDGSPALQTPIGWPIAVTADVEGTLYVLHHFAEVFRVKDGVFTPIAGGGDIPSAQGDGHPATEVALELCEDIAVSPDGETLLIAEAGGQRVRAVDVGPGGTGRLSTYIGTGEGGYIQPGVGPLETPIGGPRNVFFHDGLVYVSSGATAARLKDGVMELLLTSPGYADSIGFTGPTTFNTGELTGMAVDRHGSLYYIQSSDNAVYGVPAGSAHAQALIGQPDHPSHGYNLDEGRADQIWLPNGFAAFAETQEGDILVAVPGHSVIRQLRW